MLNIFDMKNCDLQYFAFILRIKGAHFCAFVYYCVILFRLKVVALVKSVFYISIQVRLCNKQCSFIVTYTVLKLVSNKGYLLYAELKSLAVTRLKAGSEHGVLNVSLGMNVCAKV